MLLLRLAGFLPVPRASSSDLPRRRPMRIARGATLYTGAEIRAARKSPSARAPSSGTVVLDGRSGLTIGRNVNLSTGVWIWTLEHDPLDPRFGTREARWSSVTGPG